MLVRRISSGGFVCLQCHLRLASTLTRGHPPIWLPPLRRFPPRLPPRLPPRAATLILSRRSSSSTPAVQGQPVDGVQACGHEAPPAIVHARGLPPENTTDGGAYAGWEGRPGAAQHGENPPSLIPDQLLGHDRSPGRPARETDTFKPRGPGADQQMSSEAGHLPLDPAIDNDGPALEGPFYPPFHADDEPDAPWNTPWPDPSEIPDYASLMPPLPVEPGHSQPATRSSALGSYKGSGTQDQRLDPESGHELAPDELSPPQAEPRRAQPEEADTGAESQAETGLDEAGRHSRFAPEAEEQAQARTGKIEGKGKDHRTKMLDDDYLWRDPDLEVKMADPLDQASRPPAANKLSSPKILWKRSGILSAGQRELSIDTLGKPGHAIVLRHTGRGGKKNRQLEAKRVSLAIEDLDEAPEANAHHPTVQGVLIQQGASPSENEVYNNLEELRPRAWDKSLSHDTFANVQRAVVRGFTIAQLRGYLARNEPLVAKRLMDAATNEQAEVEQQAKIEQRAKIEQTNNDQATNEHPELDPIEPLGTQGSLRGQPWIIERRPWLPLAHQHIKDIDGDPITRGYGGKADNLSQKLAKQIMIRCWGLSDKRVERKVGSIRVRIKDLEMDLLLLGNRKHLTSIYAEDLQPSDQLIYDKKTRWLSIVGSRPRAEEILHRIGYRCRLVTTVKLTADRVSPEPLEPALLNVLSRNLGVVIQLDEDGRELHLWWIQDPGQPKVFEGVGDIALRFLLYARGMKPRDTTSMTVLNPVGQDVQRPGRYILCADIASRLPWYHGLQQWVRWVTQHDADRARALAHGGAGGELGELGERPWTRPYSAEETRSSRAEEEPPLVPLTPIPSDAVALPFKVHEPPTTGQSFLMGPTKDVSGHNGWSMNMITSTCAVFGHVVHGARDVASARAPSALLPYASVHAVSAANTTLDRSLPRTFVPVFPPLFRLAGLRQPDLSTEDTGKQSVHIVLHFLPAPRQASSAVLVRTAPPLQLHVVASSEDGPRRITSLRAMSGGTHTTDVLVPSGHVDVRIVQERYHELDGAWLTGDDGGNVDDHGRGSSPPADTEGLVDFVNASDLLSDDGTHGRINTPARVNGVLLPRRLLTAGLSAAQVQQVDEVVAHQKKASEAAGKTSERDRYRDRGRDRDGDREEEEKQEEEEDEAKVKVDYLFASVEVHRVVLTEYQGFRLQYRNVMAGKHGGRRTEMVLDAVYAHSRQEDMPDDDDDEQQQQQHQQQPQQQEEEKEKYKVHNDKEGVRMMMEREVPPPSSIPGDVKSSASFLDAVSQLAQGSGAFRWHGDNRYLLPEEEPAAEAKE